MATRVAVVTGANKGIGFFTAQGLCRQLPAGSVVYVCARNKDLGLAAVQKLKDEGAVALPRYFPLDVREPSQVLKLRDHLAKEHGGLDILINNAAISFKAQEPTPAQARETCFVNYDCVKVIMKELCPVLRRGARVVNVGSFVGAVEYLNEEDRATMMNPSLTIADIDRVRDNHYAIIDAGKHELNKFPYSSYGFSKTLLHGLTRVYARDTSSVVKDPADVCINVMCPGWCKTDMGGWEEPKRTGEQGADTAVWAALLAPGAPAGVFYADRKERVW